MTTSNPGGGDGGNFLDNYLAFLQGPDHGVTAGPQQYPVAVVDPSTRDANGQTPLTGSNNVFVGPAGAPLVRTTDPVGPASVPTHANWNGDMIGLLASIPSSGPTNPPSENQSELNKILGKVTKGTLDFLLDRNEERMPEIRVIRKILKPLDLIPAAVSAWQAQDNWASHNGPDAPLPWVNRPLAFGKNFASTYLDELAFGLPGKVVHRYNVTNGTCAGCTQGWDYKYDPKTGEFPPIPYGNK